MPDASEAWIESVTVTPPEDMSIVDGETVREDSSDDQSLD